MKTKKRKRRRKPKPREFTYVDFRQAGFRLSKVTDPQGREVGSNWYWPGPGGDEEGERRLPGSAEWIRRRAESFHTRTIETFGEGRDRRVMDRQRIERMRRARARDDQSY